MMMILKERKVSSYFFKLNIVQVQSIRFEVPMSACTNVSPTFFLQNKKLFKKELTEMSGCSLFLCIDNTINEYFILIFIYSSFLIYLTFICKSWLFFSLFKLTQYFLRKKEIKISYILHVYKFYDINFMNIPS